MSKMVAAYERLQGRTDGGIDYRRINHTERMNAVRKVQFNPAPRLVKKKSCPICSNNVNNWHYSDGLNVCGKCQNGWK